MSGSGAELSETQNAPENGADANAPAAEGERMVCRRVETSSGSRLGTRRVCRTLEQWRNAQRGS